MMHASIINSIEGSSPAQTGKTIGPASNDDSAKNALQAEDLIRLVVLWQDECQPFGGQATKPPVFTHSQPRGSRIKRSRHV